MIAPQSKQSIAKPYRQKVISAQICKAIALGCHFGEAGGIVPGGGGGEPGGGGGTFAAGAIGCCWIAPENCPDTGTR